MMALVAMAYSVGFIITCGVRVSRPPLKAGWTSHRLESPMETFWISSPASSSTSHTRRGSQVTTASVRPYGYWMNSVVRMIGAGWPDAHARIAPRRCVSCAPPSPPAGGELGPPDDPQGQAAMRAWTSGQPAPIIRTTEFVQYPYGLTEAAVTCEPLRVCDVELDAGEEIQNVSIGDSSRWLVHPAFSGGRETLTPHVMVKPTEYAIATNAIITTNRRTYYLGLVSKGKSDPGYVRRVKFYYPQDLVEQANGTFRAKGALGRRDADPAVAQGPRLAPERLASRYYFVGAQ